MFNFNWLNLVEIKEIVITRSKNGQDKKCIYRPRRNMGRKRPTR